VIAAVSSVLPITPLTAGAVLAHLAQVAFLAVMWFGYLRRRARAPAVLALLLVACFPAFVYQDAVFPVSIALTAIAASLLLLARGRPLAGGIAGAVAVVTYPSGFTLVGVCVLWVLLCRSSGHRDTARPRTVARYCMPLVVAYVAVMAGFQLAVGHWNAWMLVQRHYGYGPTFFLDAWWSHVRLLVPVWIGTTAPALQTILVAAVVVGGLAAAWRYRPELDRLELAVVAYAVVFWLAPLSLGGALSLYRAEALLAPVAVVSVRWRRSAQVAALIACAMVGLLMAIAFFEGALV